MDDFFVVDVEDVSRAKNSGAFGGCRDCLGEVFVRPLPHHRHLASSRPQLQDPNSKTIIEKRPTFLCKPRRRRPRHGSDHSLCFQVAWPSLTSSGAVDSSVQPVKLMPRGTSHWKTSLRPLEILVAQSTSCGGLNRQWWIWQVSDRTGIRASPL
jgi:hypothetical protein